MLSALLAVIALAACKGVLDVDFPGRIVASQLDDPTKAAVLVTSVQGDFDCAYNNYVTASSLHSDEFEGANNNPTPVNWTHRSLGADQTDYSVGPCEVAGQGPGNLGLHVPMQTARFMSEDVFRRLNAWTDAQVPNRATLLATVRTYGAYTYLFFGETYCSIAFDKGPEMKPVDALALAEAKFGEAITLAQAAGATQILNFARTGMARVKMDLKKWSEAVTYASQVPAGFRQDADRGNENDRRYNKIFLLNTQNGVYVVAIAYRTMNDPRVQVVDAGKASGNAAVRLWITTKYTSLASPIRLASYEEARLIQAEALAQQGDVPGSTAILNSRRAALGLSPLTAANQTEAINNVISERQRELSFEGGHRLNDLLRMNISWKVGTSPFLGLPYGSTTCWPLPTVEKSGA